MSTHAHEAPGASPGREPQPPPGGWGRTRVASDDPRRPGHADLMWQGGYVEEIRIYDADGGLIKAVHVDPPLPPVGYRFVWRPGDLHVNGPDTPGTEEST